MRHYAFRFLLGGSTVVRHPLAKNEIPLDFSQSLQRAGQHIFLHAHDKVGCPDQKFSRSDL